MTTYGGLTRHVHPNGDETWTDIYDGSTQTFTKADLQKNAAKTDDELIKERKKPAK